MNAVYLAHCEYWLMIAARNAVQRRRHERFMWLRLFEGVWNAD